MQILTKSDYILGLECPKYLWLKIHHPEKIRKATVSKEFLFEEGYKVGNEAKKLFPKGIDLSVYKSNIENAKLTQETLKEKKPIFEAGFQFNNLFSRADVLVPVKNNQWDIVEVKASTKAKNINIYDVSFQKYVYESSGLKIRKCFILHLNNEYHRKGKLNLRKLFKKTEITKEVIKASKGIEERIKKIFEYASSNNAPKAGLVIEVPFNDGNHDCKKENCLELAENNVFCLYRGGKLSCKLFEDGIELIKNIPEDIKLNNKQAIQRECEIKHQTYVNNEKIIEFLKNLEYPLYYLDFETYSTSIPMFNGLKPYSQVPFQFSLHIVKEDNSEPEHHEFLYEGNSDPRKDFIEALKKFLGDEGTIIVYNQSFEINRLKELGENFPKYKGWIEEIPKRTVDLLILFREFSYYDPKQQGSASIKKVLPALTGKSYKGMEISDGGTASVEFFNITYKKCSEEQRNKVRENLLKYCGLDTEAEIMIIERLKDFVVEKELVN